MDKEYKNTENALLEVLELTKSFGETQVLKGISFSLKKGEVLAIIGSSGSGKTTLLRCLNFLETADGGRILVDGTPVFDAADPSLLHPKNIRKNRLTFGLVFQNFQLFPQYSVLQNLTLAATLSAKQNDPEYKTDKKKILDAIDTRALALLERIGLAEKKDNYPCQLSGGQQQRVAIARALVTEPAIICMDEPLSNLDAKLRVQLRNELKKMQKDFGITTIYVTHDQEEALTLSDRIAVFNKGYIEQIGTPNEVYNFSRTEFVCNFIGDINRLSDDVVRKAAAMYPDVDVSKHNYVRLERLHVNVDLKPGQIGLDGVVTMREYYGLYIKYYIDLGSQTIKVIEKNDGVRIYEEGQKVQVVLDPRDIMAYKPEEKAEVAK